LQVLRGRPERPDAVVFHAHARHPGVGNPVRFADLDLEWLPPDPLASRFDVELRLVPAPAGQQALLFYNAARIPAAYASDLLRAYLEVCTVAAEEPGRSLAGLA
jgi:hypothetical protein